MPVAAILGTAFADRPPAGLRLTPVIVATERGPVQLHRVEGGMAWVSFRHGQPHRCLPHQIDFRAQALALAKVGVGALLVTSSAGVLDPDLPLGVPLPVEDLLMPDNRLPDGSACTMWPTPRPDHGHLVLEEGLLNHALNRQLLRLAHAHGASVGPAVTFGYAPGPRTKTPAENRLWASWGAQVNSMSVGPELVLANELEIPTAAVVVGHKYSHPDHHTADAPGIAASLVDTRDLLEKLVVAFLRHGEPEAFANHIFRFDSSA